MNTSIETLIHRYRLQKPADRSRLDDLAHGPVLDAYESALSTVFKDDKAVYLVRRIAVRNVMSRAAFTDQAALARHWGNQLASAVARTIAADSGEGNVVRYPSVAAYVADFLEEILAGRPADDWVFAPFKPFRQSSVRETLSSVLCAYREQFGAIIRHVQEARLVPKLLSQLDGATIGLLWREGVAGLTSGEHGGEPALFAAALQLLKRLGCPHIDRTRANSWFAEYVAGHPSAADWRDRTSLANEVYAVLCFLVSKLPVRPSHGALAQLTSILAEFDWLDSAALGGQVMSLLNQPSPFPGIRGWRRMSGASLKQREILTLLREALSGLLNALDRADLDGPRNCLLLHAAVTEKHEAWASDRSVAGLLQHILSAARLVGSSPAPDRLLNLLKEGALREAPGMLPTGTDVRPLRAVVGLGSEAAAIVATIAAVRRAPASGSDRGVETEAAGILLLLRAVQDLRLLPLLRECLNPASGTAGISRFLSQLAVSWAGLPEHKWSDPAIVVLSSTELPPRENVFHPAREHDAVDVHSFQFGLAKRLLDHRLLDPAAPVRVAVAQIGERKLLLAGDETAQLWPFIAPFQNIEETAGILRAWAADWNALVENVSPFVVPECLAGVFPGYPQLSADDAPAHVNALVAALLPGDDALTWQTSATLAAAHSLVQAWARWLKHLGRASVPYLLEQFIRRRGSISWHGGVLDVELEPRPLDMILQLSGYLEPVEWLSGLPMRTIRFHLPTRT